MRHHPRTALAVVLLAATTAAAASKVAPHADPPLLPRQIHELVEQVLANQRRDAAALEQYARTERDVQIDPSKHTTTETLTRVVPTGAGNLHLQLERDGKPADPDDIQRAWQNLARSLAADSHPDDPKVRNARERYQKRRHEKLQMVQEIGKAFRFDWAGRVRENGRTLIVLKFQPLPGYHSPLRFGRLYAHARGTIWVDASSRHLVRLVAVLSDDVSFGAGILAKVYRGGRFTVEQAEVAPGVWEPTHYTYDFDGRKLFLAANVHERIEIGAYRHVGPPQQALSLVRREHPAVLARDP